MEPMLNLSDDVRGHLEADHQILADVKEQQRDYAADVVAVNEEDVRAKCSPAVTMENGEGARQMYPANIRHRARVGQYANGASNTHDGALTTHHKRKSRAVHCLACQPC